VIAPEPEQVGALYRFGHGLFRLLQPGDELRLDERFKPFGSRFSVSRRCSDRLFFILGWFSVFDRLE
jgi:hypothetical protein